MRACAPVALCIRWGLGTLPGGWLEAAAPLAGAAGGALSAPPAACRAATAGPTHQLSAPQAGGPQRQARRAWSAIPEASQPQHSHAPAGGSGGGGGGGGGGMHATTSGLQHGVAPAAPSARPQHGAAAAAGAGPGVVDDFMGRSINGATMLGQLRRLMLRYRAMLLPRHVVDVLLAMERITSGRAPPRPDGAAGAPAPPDRPTPRSSGLRSVRVVNVQQPPTTASLESQGPERQTIMYMMGDLGNMLWGHLGEIDAAGLANCLWCWARLSWHPEPQLLSEVSRRFLDPATLGGVGANELVRGVWGLSALDALGQAELAAALPRIREAAPEMDVHQLRALSRALGAAANEGSGNGGGGGGNGNGGGGGGGGDGGGGAYGEAAALATELAERAERLRAQGGGTPRA